MLLAILFTWLGTALSLWIVTKLVPGVKAHSTAGLFWAAFVLGLVNLFIRPILWFLTLPLTILSFGLFALVINALTLWLSAAMVKDFEIEGFGSALLAAILMALLGLLGLFLLPWLLGGDVQWMMYQGHSHGMM